MRSRTAGASSLPIKSEADVSLEALAAQIAREQGISMAEAMEIARGYAGESDMASVDRLRGDEPGTERVWNQAAGRYDTVRSRPPQPTPPDPELGARWGGGEAFRSPAEREAYYNRRTLTAEQRQDMLDQGATEEEIADAQASQYDRDARQAGLGTHGGYAPVFVNGRVVMAPRAPTPDFSDRDYVERVVGAGNEMPVHQGSADASAAYKFAQDMLASGIDDQTPIAVGDDGLPVVPGWRQGTANAATGNEAAGPRAANRDVPPSLRRPDLEERGYEAVFMRGPNGGEWVYQLKDTTRLANRARNEQDRAARTAQRLRVQAGVVGNPMYDGADNAQLRELIAAKRAEEEKAKEMLWRPRAMIRGGNAIGALALPGLTPGQEAAMLGGPTPLDVQARSAEMASRMAQQAMTAFLTNNPGMTPEQRAALNQRLRQGDPTAAGAADLSGRNPESAEAQAELDRLAASIDDTWGGFSYENERTLAQKLQGPPYNMSQSAAEEYAYRAAERRRRLWNQGGGRAQAATPSSPASGGAPAWGGAPPQGGM